jgi:hypothetical protein
MTIDDIRREDFEAYEDLRVSGITNMYAMNIVMEFTGLSCEKIIVIQKNFKELKDKFLGGL